MAGETHAVFVAGCHRSGTSAMARALNLAGLALPGELRGAGRGNDHGHWEPIAVTRLNEDLLESVGRSWFDPKPLPEGWSASEAARACGGKAGDFMRDAAAESFAIKDPRLSRTGSVWRAAAEAQGLSPAVVIMCRNPYDVARSLVSRNGFSKMHGLRLWQSYMLEALRESAGLPRVLVHYEDLLADPQRELGRVSEALRISGLKTGEAVPSIRPEESHSHETAEFFLARPTVPDDIRQLYRLCLDPHARDGVGAFASLECAWRAWWSKTDGGDGPSALARGSPEAFLSLSMQALNGGHLGEALEQARKAVAASPAHAPLHAHLGNILIHCGDAEDAIASYRASLSLDGKQAGLALTLAHLLRKRGEQAAALDTLAACAAANPGDAKLNHALGDQLLLGGDLPGAALAFVAALGLEGETAPLALSFARLALAGGARDAARGHAMRVLQLDAASDAVREAAERLLEKLRR
ncbi:hypothetical protein [Aestuariivirga sp.]|uniref:hypothetical protein n=1 Tax=Aestuariivirga sp. TaxID=2650926 RepID=UPI0039E5BED0